MKTLYIVRHAKSSWDDLTVEDINRPINSIGIKKTKKVIDYFHKINLKIDLIVSSPAKRALETANLVAKYINYPEENIKINPNIYQGSLSTILDAIYEQPDECSSLMIFGHNPVFTEISNYFLDKKIANLPTTGVVSIKFYMKKWIEITKAKRLTNFVVFPNELP